MEWLWGEVDDVQQRSGPESLDGSGAGRVVRQRGFRPGFRASQAPDAAFAAMSVRCWEPSSRIRATARYARSRASVRFLPDAVTDRTRPPALTTASPSRLVPACRTYACGASSAATSSRPVIGSPVRGVAG